MPHLQLNPKKNGEELPTQHSWFYNNAMLKRVRIIKLRNY